MRIHISLDERLVSEIDELVGPRGRSPFVAEAVRRAVEEERGWRALERAAGAVSDQGHDWDADPAAWVRAQRRTDARRVG
jgi:Arc/MetJ-type ribon-helix-helix transcriptional regulator